MSVTDVDRIRRRAVLIACLALRALERRRARGLPAVSYATVGAVLMIAMIAVMLFLALRDPGGLAAQRLGP
jgi:hypothetical protein